MEVQDRPSYALMKSRTALILQSPSASHCALQMATFFDSWAADIMEIMGSLDSSGDIINLRLGPSLVVSKWVPSAGCWVAVDAQSVSQ